MKLEKLIILVYFPFFIYRPTPPSAFDTLETFIVHEGKFEPRFYRLKPKKRIGDYSVNTE